MTIRIVVDNDPVALAWAEFDRAALALREMYQGHDTARFSVFDRMEKAAEAAQLWERWRLLYLTAHGSNDPGEAA